MAVKFLLDNAHPDYRSKVEGILTGLLSKYPFVDLKLVHVFTPDKDDKSMGNANVKGEIALNGFWFSRDLKFLEESALRDVFVDVGGRRIAWHGKLVVEPDHVLTHEFGHLLSDKIPKWEEWTKPRWREATANPNLAPSGYSLSSDIDEFWAELFALIELGLASREQIRDFCTLLGD